MSIKLFLCLVLCVMSRLTLGQRKAKKFCSEMFPPRPSVHGIVGGVQTDENEFPHTAALGYGDTSNPDWLCGGSLISLDFVLTAGHCAETHAGPVKKVRLGTRTLANPSVGYEDINVKDITVHPSYNPPSQYNDIALLRLARNASLSQLILPACLQTTTAITSSQQLTAIGWGKTDFAGSTSNDLLKVNLNIFPRNSCNNFYKNIGKSKLRKGIDSRSQICAGGDSNEEKDTCQGDSGGPLGYKKGKSHYLVGITSFGKACGLSGVPAVYTRISAFVPWIESTVWR